VVLVGSMALAWWTFVHGLAPLQEQSRELTAKFGRLSSEMDNLERKWSKAQMEEIRSKYKEAYSQLFADEPALQAWLAGLEEQAAPLGLDVKVDFGQVR